MKQTIKLYTSKKSGDLDYTYKPLRNMYESVSDYSLKDFTTKNLHYTPDNPVTIECQESYDGSVNLLITDYNDVPRIINSAFTVQENDKYERIVRNQAVATNYYADSTVDSTTRLQRSLSADSNFLTIDLKSVEEGGQLLGGNYVFMIKYCDEDNNETSIISESGIVSIFKGTTSSNVEGTIANEATNKSVALRLTNLDPTYNRFKIVYKRSFCDLTGTLDYEFKEIKNPYKVNVLEDGSMLVYILGTEPTIDVTYDSIIAQVNIYDSVRTEAQIQNTLFFGNVAGQVEQQVFLQKLSYKGLTKWQNCQTEYVSNIFGVSGDNEKVPASYYGLARYVKFEDILVPIPEKAEEYNTHIYGNFMELPPKEKRVPSHFRFENEENGGVIYEQINS